MGNKLNIVQEIEDKLVDLADAIDRGDSLVEQEIIEEIESALNALTE